MRHLVCGSKHSNKQKRHTSELKEHICRVATLFGSLKIETERFIESLSSLDNIKEELAKGQKVKSSEQVITQ